ncbi:MAG: class I SAM-dependent methyltransferase [Aureispira sp.]|nr:class I SAM-dependent methyltransferase [Aureispira sp.]
MEQYSATVARFYDLVYDKIRTGVDTQYFMDKILACKGRVLEVGVGTGRFFIEALQKGADIYGIDISAPMLTRLKDKIPQAEWDRVEEQSVTAMQLNGQFDLIVAPFRVFSHLITIEEQLAALESIHQHLKPGGQLIFDLFVPNMVLCAQGKEPHIDFDGEYAPNKKLQRITSFRPNPIEQINHVQMEFIWEDENNETQKHIWSFDMRYYFQYEIRHLIKRSPLILTNIYGDYDEGNLTAESKDFVVVCERV